MEKSLEAIINNGYLGEFIDLVSIKVKDTYKQIYSSLKEESNLSEEILAYFPDPEDSNNPGQIGGMVNEFRNNIKKGKDRIGYITYKFNDLITVLINNNLDVADFVWDSKILEGESRDINREVREILNNMKQEFKNSLKEAINKFYFEDISDEEAIKSKDFDIIPRYLIRKYDSANSWTAFCKKAYSYTKMEFIKAVSAILINDRYKRRQELENYLSRMLNLNEPQPQELFAGLLTSKTYKTKFKITLNKAYSAVFDFYNDNALLSTKNIDRSWVNGAEKSLQELKQRGYLKDGIKYKEYHTIPTLHEKIREEFKERLRKPELQIINKAFMSTIMDYNRSPKTRG